MKYIILILLISGYGLATSIYEHGFWNVFTPADLIVIPICFVAGFYMRLLISNPNTNP